MTEIKFTKEAWASLLQYVENYTKEGMEALENFEGGIKKLRDERTLCVDPMFMERMFKEIEDNYEYWTGYVSEEKKKEFLEKYQLDQKQAEDLLLLQIKLQENFEKIEGSYPNITIFKKILENIKDIKFDK